MKPTEGKGMKQMTEELHEVGCRKCGEAGNWKIFTDGDGHFKAEHPCGHVSDFEIVTKPDPITIPLRLLL